MAACVEVEPAAAARPAGLKRKRIAVSSAEPYDEMSRLGEGAFGAVVKARHRATGEIVAIKRVGSEARGGHAALLREARFLEEASGGGSARVPRRADEAPCSSDTRRLRCPLDSDDRRRPPSR